MILVYLYIFILQHSHFLSSIFTFCFLLTKWAYYIRVHILIHMLFEMFIKRSVPNCYSQYYGIVLFTFFSFCDISYLKHSLVFINKILCVNLFSYMSNNSNDKIIYINHISGTHFYLWNYMPWEQFSSKIVPFSMEISKCIFYY